MPAPPPPAALIPDNDAARLAALARYQILDARSEKVIDEVVALAARLFQVSNAMLSIIEENEVLVKAPYNLPVPVERVPRNNSLCSATILQNETVVYETLTPESAPAVDISLLQQLGLKFYAGHNLHTADGYNIGSLCLYHTDSRKFSDSERTLLATFARVVMRLLDLRLALGASPDTSFALWEPVYQAIGGQLARLNALANAAAPTDGPLSATTAMQHEATAIAGIIEQFIGATLRRV